MDEKSQNDIINILMKSGRMDLVAIIMTLFDEIDSDFEPDLDQEEPAEEYYETGAIGEEIDPDMDDDGFHFLR